MLPRLMARMLSFAANRKRNGARYVPPVARVAYLHFIAGSCLIADSRGRLIAKLIAPTSERAGFAPVRFNSVRGFVES